MATTKPKKKTTRTKKPKGLLQKFIAYVKKNQEANRKAGEKPLSEEFGGMGKSWWNGIADGMAKVGEEESAKLHGDRAKQIEEDERTMDFLIGRKSNAGSQSKLQRGSRYRRMEQDEEGDPIDYILGRRR